MDYMPLPQPLVVYDEVWEKDPEHHYQVGLGITRKDAEALNLTGNKQIIHLEPVPAVYSVTMVTSNQESCHEYIEEIITNLAKQGFMSSGPICGRTVVPLSCATDIHGYFEFWVPYTLVNC
jgi:hypothetical protein